MGKHLIKRSIKTKQMMKRILVWIILLGMVLPLFASLVPAIKADAADNKTDIIFRNNMDAYTDLFNGIGFSASYTPGDATSIKNIKAADISGWVGKDLSILTSINTNYQLVSNPEDYKILYAKGLYGSDEGFKFLGTEYLSEGLVGVYLTCVNAKTCELVTLTLWELIHVMNINDIKSLADLTTSRKQAMVYNISSGIISPNDVLTDMMSMGTSNLGTGLFVDDTSSVYYDGQFTSNYLTTLGSDSFSTLHNSISNAITEYITTGVDTNGVISNLEKWETLATLTLKDGDVSNIKLLNTTTNSSVTSDGDLVDRLLTLGGQDGDAYVINEDGSLKGKTTLEGTYLTFVNDIWNKVVQDGFSDAAVTKIKDTGEVVPNKGYVLQFINAVATAAVEMAMDMDLNVAPNSSKNNPYLLEPCENFQMAWAVLSSSIYNLSQGNTNEPIVYVKDETDKQYVISFTKSVNERDFENKKLADFWDELTPYQQASLMTV